MRSLYLFAALALLPRVALADYTTVAPLRPLTLSDPAGLTSIAAEFQYTMWTEHPPTGDVDYTSITLDLGADIRIAPHFVLLARMPLSHASTDPGDCCALALGNFTLGGRGLWSSVGATSRSVIGGELSASLPTASDSGERGISAAASAFAQLPHDPGRYAPNTTTLRLKLMGQFYNRWFLVDAEAGGQLYLYDGDVPGDNDYDLGLRLALAAGIRATYTVAILAELSSLFLSDDEFAGNNDTVTSVDLGVRYASQALILGGRVYIPLDSEMRDRDMLGIGLDVGARF
jgi:hypothetical protein